MQSPELQVGEKSGGHTSRESKTVEDFISEGGCPSSGAGCRWWCGEGESTWSRNYRRMDVYLTNARIKMWEELHFRHCCMLNGKYFSTCLCLFLTRSSASLLHVLSNFLVAGFVGLFFFFCPFIPPSLSCLGALAEGLFCTFAL